LFLFPSPWPPHISPPPPTSMSLAALPDHMFPPWWEQAQTQWSQVTIDWDFWNHEPKETFPHWSWFSQVFCHLRKSSLS
jgi:hypothetical protein